MSGPSLFASLLLAGSFLAPALPPRTDWVGETVFLKKSGTIGGEIESDGSFKPTGTVRSIQYVVTRDQKDRVQVIQDGKPLWIAKGDLVRLKDAVDHYTKSLDADPNNDIWYAFRGWARFRQGQVAEALKDYSEALRLSPKAYHWYANRGVIHLGAAKVDEAIADFTTSLELHPANEFAVRNRGMAYGKKKDFARAAADYLRAVELNPESAVNQNQLAWILCTAPDDKVRNGKEALAAATKACELSAHKNGGYLDTLAAAYAELGQFDKAVEWQEKALRAGDIPIKDLDAARKRLELFKQKKPYRADE